MAGLPAVLLIAYIRFVAGLRTRPADEPAWAEEWSSLLAERGVRRPIPLRVTDQLGPMLCRLPAGYCLIVPEWLWRRLDPGERQVILRHELAHYIRGDVWKSLAIRALALPHWFNPFAWWAVRTFDECGEWACDDVATGPEPTAGAAYARVLLQLVEAGHRRPSFGFSARGSSLATRVRRLLQPRPAGEPMRIRLIVLGVLLVLAAFQPGSARVGGQADPSRPARDGQDRSPWRPAPARCSRPGWGRCGSARASRSSGWPSRPTARPWPAGTGRGPSACSRRRRASRSGATIFPEARPT